MAWVFYCLKCRKKRQQAECPKCKDACEYREPVKEGQ
jgi:hypothetical protein